MTATGGRQLRIEPSGATTSTGSNSASLAGNLRHEGRLERDERAAPRVVHAAVDGAQQRLRRGPLVVHGQALAVHGQRRRDRRRLAAVAVADDRVPVSPGRDPGDRPAHGVGGAAADAPGDGPQVGQAVLLEELAHALRRHVEGGPHRPQVADDQVGDADVGPQDREQLLVGHPGPEEPARRQVQPLLEDVPRVEVADVAAVVRHVGERGDVGDDPAAVEDRADEAEVGEVAGGDPRVVRAEDVAVLEGGRREALEQGPGGVGKDPGEHRQARQRLGEADAVLVEEREAEVARLADDRREGGAEERLVGLAHQGDQAVPVDLERDRIDVRHSVTTTLSSEGGSAPLPNLPPGCCAGKARARSASQGERA